MKPAWDIRAVKPKAEVQARARKNKVTVNFGRLMELCHMKNAELPKEYQSYKGRIVFRGDDIKDEEGFKAVFTEQSTSSAHMAATKFLDAIARFP